MYPLIIYPLAPSDSWCSRGSPCTKEASSQGCWHCIAKEDEVILIVPLQFPLPCQHSHLDNLYPYPEFCSLQFAAAVSHLPTCLYKYPPVFTNIHQYSLYPVPIIVSSTLPPIHCWSDHLSLQLSTSIYQYCLYSMAAEVFDVLLSSDKIDCVRP